MGILDLIKKPKTEPVSPQLPKYKILVADDDQYLREFYQELLVGEGYEVITATNGQEALVSVFKHQPNVIILDIMMPVMDGNEVLVKLWNNEQTKKIPVIILTNAGNIDNMDNAKFYSAYKFMIKANITPEEIIETVAQALRARQSESGS